MNRQNASKMSEIPPPRPVATDEIARLRQRASLAPQDPDLRLDLARRFLEHSLADEAVDEIRSVISMAPNHLDARKLLDVAIKMIAARRSHSSPTADRRNCR